MKIFKKLNRTRKGNLKITLSILVVIIIVMVLVSVLMYLTIEKNVRTRVKDESQFLAEQQVEFVDGSIEAQFKIVSCIAGLVERGLSFSDEGNRAILDTLVKKNTLCMLAYADENGDVMNYQGEVFGNVSDRDYFRDVFSGKKKFDCQYLPTAGDDQTPRLIFSTAVRSSGKIKGVVFISKEVGVLRNSLFGHSMFEGKDSSVVVDGEGNILVRNSHAEEKYGKIDNITEISSDVDWKEFLRKKNGSVIVGGNEGFVLASASIDQDDWKLVCLIDMNSARQKYAANLISIRHLVLLSSACFILAGSYFVVLGVLQFRKNKESYEVSRMQYDRVIQLLEKMKCMIFDYNIANGKIKSNDLFEKNFELKMDDNLLSWIEERKKDHQEFDFDGLIREAKYAIKNKEPVSMGSIYQTDDNTYKMYSVVMMPIMDANGQTTNILGCIKESSDEHHQLKEEVELFHQIPGGIYRIYLENPVHVDYLSERLCEMMGYSQEEFNGVTGRYYKNSILEEDREKYLEFIEEAATNPGVRKCEYRLRHKNGEVIPILETMETMRNDSGCMYGYSVVVDVTEYEKRQKLVLQELHQLEEGLQTLRIQNSASQMQPHFLYNALSSIREIVLLDSQYASDLIYDFTTFLRACIHSMDDGTLISIHQEMDNVRAYVNIEKMRMGGRLEVTYDLKSEDFKIAPLSIQPIVENAIRHGVYRKGKQGGTVRISTKTFKKWHVVTVTDNGVGFDYQKLRDDVETGVRDSIGLDNVIFRLKKQLNGEVIIRSRIGAGTVITIRIPKENGKEGTER